MATKPVLLQTALETRVPTVDDISFKQIAVNSTNGLMYIKVQGTNDVEPSIKSIGDESVTTMTLDNHILSYTDENGLKSEFDLSGYIDPSAPVVTSGVLNTETGIITFTKSDSNTFDVDVSGLSVTIDKPTIDALNVDAGTVNGKTVETSVPANAVFTDTVVSDVSELTDTTGLLNSESSNTISLTGGVIEVTSPKTTVETTRDVSVSKIVVNVNRTSSYSAFKTTFLLSNGTPFVHGSLVSVDRNSAVYDNITIRRTDNNGGSYGIGQYGLDQIFDEPSKVSNIDGMADDSDAYFLDTVDAVLEFEFNSPVQLSSIKTNLVSHSLHGGTTTEYSIYVGDVVHQSFNLTQVNQSSTNEPFNTTVDDGIVTQVIEGRVIESYSLSDLESRVVNNTNAIHQVLLHLGIYGDVPF